jgi:hypothetical protein
MGGRAHLVLSAVFLLAAIPALAQAPSPTRAFDGRYAGVSVQSTKSGAYGRCPPPGVPAELVIANGVAKDLERCLGRHG